MDDETLEAWAQTHPVTVEITRDRGTQVDSDMWEHHAYVLTLNIDGHRLSQVEWRQGMGVETSPTDTPVEVLSAVLCDASTADQRFEDWCDDYGLDSDSRKAYATWEACRSLRENLAHVLPAETFSALMAL